MRPIDRLALLALALTAILSNAGGCAVAVGDEAEIPILDADGKSDGYAALSRLVPAVGGLIRCRAETGCRGHIALDLLPLAESHGTVAIDIGRSLTTLARVATITVDGARATTVPFEVAPTTDYLPPNGIVNPMEALLLVVRLVDPPAPINVDWVTCVYDPGEPNVEAPLHVSPRPDTSHTYTIQDSSDVDRFSAEVLDQLDLDFGYTGPMVVKTTSDDASLRVDVSYVCRDGTRLPFSHNPYSTEEGRELVPNCPGTIDDSGRIEVEVSGPTASPWTCPRYEISAVVPNGHG